MKLYYGIWCKTWGGATGPRHSWLRSDGEIQDFATLEEAEEVASRLNKAMSKPSTKAKFRYTATVLGDADVADD